MDQIIYEKLKRQYAYAYWAAKGSPRQQQLWWAGYIECLQSMLELVRALRKEQRRWN